MVMMVAGERSNKEGTVGKRLTWDPLRGRVVHSFLPPWASRRDVGDPTPRSSWLLTPIVTGADGVQ